MATPAEVLNDDRFWALPVGERRKVLTQIDPRFSYLSEPEQIKVVGQRGIQKETDPEKLFSPEQRGNLKKTQDYIDRNTPKDAWSQAGDFVSTIATDVVGAGKAANALFNPLAKPKDTSDLIKSVFTGQIDQFKKAGADFQQGKYSEAAGHAAAGALPLVGPAAAQAGEEIGDKNFGAGTAHILELFGPSVAGKMMPSKIGGRIAKSVNNPMEEAALKSVEPHVRMSVGQRTGRVGLKRVEQTLPNLPGSATRAEEFYHGQEADLTREAYRRTAAAGGQQTNPFGAGEAVQQRLQQRITNLKSQADKLYADVRKSTAANKQTVQTGTKQSSVLEPNGQPLTTPTFATLETPVDLAPIRSQLQPIYDELKRSLPDARKANSPAWKSLEDLMNSKDSQMNAMDFDRTLSAVKSITRDGNSDILNTRSQGLAKQIIKAGEGEFQKALRGAGSDVNAKLASARRIVRSYYDTDELLGSLQSEPAALYKHLVTGGDRVFNTLSDLQKVAPNEMKTVGRTYLEGMLEKATGEGGFQRASGVKADWERLGPETKELLFGKQLTGEMDKFMLAAKRLTSPLNASGSGHMIASLGSLGAAGEVMRALITGNPTEAAAVAGTAFVVPNIASRLLLTPGGANIMTRLIELPTGSKAWGKAGAALSGLVSEISNEDKKKESQGMPPPPQR